jgi:hypothetical protein
MEKISAGLAVFLHKLRISTLAVHIVTHHGMPDRREMDTNLMRSTGSNPYFQK